MIQTTDVAKGKWYWARYECVNRTSPDEEPQGWMIVEVYGNEPFLRIRDVINERYGDMQRDDLPLSYVSRGHTWDLFIYREVEKPI